MSKASTRPRKTRNDEERIRDWEPPQKLKTPEPPDGYKYRWVRCELTGTQEDQNVYERQRQGYVVVRSEEISNQFPYIDTVQEGRHTGVVRNGDLILMKVSTRIAKQRRAHYDNMSNRQVQAVNNELATNDTDVMPVTNDSKSRVIRGQPIEERSVEFEDD